MKLTITGYSTALFSTWYFIEKLGLLFDLGDGVTSALMQKARKIDHVFISHADRDHLTGLLQFNQLNARSGFPKLFYPFDCGYFPALAEFSKKFDPHVEGTVWTPMKNEEKFFIKEDFFVQGIRNTHVPSEPNIHKSFGYRVCQTKNKLKAEFTNRPQEKIKELIVERGKENMTDQFQTNVLNYSGDTPVADLKRWNHTKILIHEATFLDASERDVTNPKRNKHSTLEEFLKMVSDLSIETLILGHFSSRYANEDIDSKIKFFCKELNIKIPVFRVLPGQVHRNILNETPNN